MSKLFGGSKPKTPKIEPPAPLPDEEELRRKSRRELSRKQSRSGRQSTVLSEGRDTLG